MREHTWGVRGRGRMAAALRSWALGAVALAVAPLPAEATVNLCLTDENGTPLRRVWVENRSEWLPVPGKEKRTGNDGCLSFDVTGPIDVRVYAHNPVIRVDNGHLLQPVPVSEDFATVRNGQTRALAANHQGAFFRVADRFLRAYDDGLRQLAPWNGDQFPAGASRDPEAVLVLVNEYILRASFPDHSLGVRAWVEGAAIVTGPRYAQAIGFPLVHIKQEDVLPPDAPLLSAARKEEIVQETFAHELGHALHFARLSNGKRIVVESLYGLFLAADPDKTHCFDKRTNKNVAWIEAFGFLSADFAATPGTGAQKHERFFTKAALRRGELLDGESATGCFPPGSPDTPETGAMFGPDVEGAVYLTLFHDFARHPSVGLDLAAETYVSCESLDIDDYAGCMAARFGPASVVYQALVSAAACNGIFLGGAASPPPVAGTSETEDHFGRALARGDFNGDGFLDLAIGVPGEDLGSAAQAGSVNVIYGLPTGLNAQCNQSFSKSTAGIAGTARSGDNFGFALSSGNFDGDDFSDLVIGVPGDALGSTEDAGSVRVLRGSPHGLDGRASESWTASTSLALTSSSPDTNAGAEMGRALATGDFNDDGVVDLAIGVPGDDIGGREAGAVIVLYGRPDLGLDALSGQRLLQPEDPEPFDRFGSSLAAGDFDNDGVVDLAAGAPGEMVGFTTGAGAVSLLYGQDDNPLGVAARHFRQGAAGLLGTPSLDDHFGANLAAGDFNNDALADLAVGVTGETAAGQPRAGAVALIFGSARTVAPRNEIWTKAACAGASPTTGDAFGEALAIGDFDRTTPGTAFVDLAIGIPGHDHGTTLDAGAACVLYSGPPRFDGSVWRPAGLGTSRSQLFTQSSPGIVGGAEAGDGLGACLVAGDFNSDGRADLAIGVPYEDLGSVSNAGAVNVLRGSSGTGLGSVGDQMWYQDQ